MAESDTTTPSSKADVAHPPQTLETTWGVFTDERPDYTLPQGSIWPSLLGLLALLGLAAAGVYARQYELDGGLLDWTRAPAEPEVTESEDVREIAHAQAIEMPPVEPSPSVAAPVAVPPGEAPVVSPSIESVAPIVSPSVEPEVAPVGNPDVEPGVAPAVNAKAEPGVASVGNPDVEPGVAPAVNAKAEPGVAPVGNPNAESGVAPVVSSPSELDAVSPVLDTPVGVEAKTPALPTCAIDGVLAGEWSYETTAMWAAHAELYDVRGEYGVAFTPHTACSYEALVRKRRSGSIALSPPHSDRVQVTATPWAGGARVEAEVRLSPRSEAALLAENFAGDPNGRQYQFAYLVEGEELKGSFRAFAGEAPLMLGILRGGRTLDGPASLSVRALPCRDQCAVRCPGEEARSRCERELCTLPTTRISDCGAPGRDFAAPAATRALDAPLAFFDPSRAGENHCRKIADHLAGSWTVHARATGGALDGKVQTYTLQLQPEGCKLVVKEARRGSWRVDISGSIRADGRWTLHYSDHGAEGDWMLVGRDPAFGTFRAKSGVSGSLAAYRTGGR